MQYLLWGILVAVAAFFFISQNKGKKKYADADFTPDTDWLEKSAAMYPPDEVVNRYYMHPDNNIPNQGVRVDDINHDAAYEVKILYATATKPFEVDFVNRIIGYTHHHQLGHPKTYSVSVGGDEPGRSFNISSMFTFDGVNIWDYLKEKGYSFCLGIAGVGYTVTVFRDGNFIGTIYSSNQGKNLYEAGGKIEAKLGGAGHFILECKNQDIDGLLLVAYAFFRTDVNPKNFLG